MSWHNPRLSADHVDLFRAFPFDATAPEAFRTLSTAGRRAQHHDDTARIIGLSGGMVAEAAEGLPRHPDQRRSRLGKAVR